nr:ataxia telangiectasia mutated family protein [Tanacetum cinerariifolium]
VCIGDKILQPKESFWYLGSMLHKYGRIDEDVSNRIKAAWMKWRAATRVLCDRNVPLKLKGKFYRVTIRPTMLYGSECWPITKAIANRVEVAELRMLRWTCGKTLFDMIPNRVYRVQLEVETIINKMRERRLRRFGHVRRRPQSSPVRRVKALVVDGLRRRGRPKLRPFVLCVVALLLVFLASLVLCLCRCMCASVSCLFGLLNGCFLCLLARFCFFCPRVCMLALRLCALRCCFRLVLPDMCFCILLLYLRLGYDPSTSHLPHTLPWWDWVSLLLLSILIVADKRDEIAKAHTDNFESVFDNFESLRYREMSVGCLNVGIKRIEKIDVKVACNLSSRFYTSKCIQIDRPPLFDFHRLVQVV